MERPSPTTVGGQNLAVSIMNYHARYLVVGAFMSAAIALNATAAAAHGGGGHAGRSVSTHADMQASPGTNMAATKPTKPGSSSASTVAVGNGSSGAGQGACAAPSSAACAASLSSAQSDLAGTSASATTVTPPPFPAAAPAAPPALTLPSVSALTPVDPVSTASGGSSPPPDYGAGGPTLASCMAIWEPALDMTKSEWKATCVRTLNGVDLPVSGNQVAHHTSQRSTHAHRNRHPTSALMSEAGGR